MYPNGDALLKTKILKYKTIFNMSVDFKVKYGFNTNKRYKYN